MTKRELKQRIAELIDENLDLIYERNSLRMRLDVRVGANDVLHALLDNETEAANDLAYRLHTAECALATYQMLYDDLALAYRGLQDRHNTVLDWIQPEGMSCSGNNVDPDDRDPGPCSVCGGPMQQTDPYTWECDACNDREDTNCDCAFCQLFELEEQA